MNMARFYLLMCTIGTILPWVFFANFFMGNGLKLPLFILSSAANPVAGGFTADILISILVFGVWSFVDARRHNVRNWWLILPATLCVGLSLSLPLYLLLRERRLTASQPS